jgi:amidase/aspartyl-tRNA(Asn)/glutamyl-tRNA(Gln) amidotransferase subunit A
MPPTEPWGFAAWAELSARDPVAAAHEVQARVRQRLTPPQQAAVVAHLVPADELAVALAPADTRAPLRGVPYFLKDLFHLAGTKTRAGARFLSEVRPLPALDSAIVQALRRCGAACAGKTHLHEFAFGLTGENPHYGDCTHPHFPERTTGGSSSGSAAAVAAGIVPFAVGTDTGGSIRVPAAFCGLFGLRLTPGHPWIKDAFPLSPSSDTPGWFTRTAEDMLAATGALVGLGTMEREPRGVYFAPAGLEPEVAAACAAAARRLAEPASPDTTAGLTNAFESAPRVHGVLTALEAARVHALWLDARRAEYGPVVWERIDQGRRWTPDEIGDAAVGHAAVRLAWTSFFLAHDFLVLPAVPFPALPQTQLNLANRRRLLALTAPASLGGLPVLTLPVPLPSGLTAGLQVVVNHPQSPVIPWALRRWGRPAAE